MTNECWKNDSIPVEAGETIGAEEGRTALDQVLIDGKLDQLDSILRTDLVHDIVAMDFHGADAEAQLGSNPLIGLTAGDELQHLALT